LKENNISLIGAKSISDALVENTDLLDLDISSLN